MNHHKQTQQSSCPSPLTDPQISTSSPQILTRGHLSRKISCELLRDLINPHINHHLQTTSPLRFTHQQNSRLKLTLQPKLLTSQRKRFSPPRAAQPRIPSNQLTQTSECFKSSSHHTDTTLLRILRVLVKRIYFRRLYDNGYL